MKTRIKFSNKGIIHYGIVKYSNTEEVRKLRLENKLLVEDAIFPKCWIVLEKNIKIVQDKEYENHIIKNFEIAKQHSDALPKGCVLGKLLRFEVAGQLPMPKGEGLAVEWL
jgi:hypothetical protein